VNQYERQSKRGACCKKKFDHVLPEMPASVPAHPDELEPSELIGQLHAAIWERMEAVRELRSKLRTECVPSSICTYLTQCLKDTDVGHAGSVGLCISYLFVFCCRLTRSFL